MKHRGLVFIFVLGTTITDLPAFGQTTTSPSASKPAASVVKPAGSAPKPAVAAPSAQPSAPAPDAGGQGGRGEGKQSGESAAEGKADSGVKPPKLIFAVPAEWPEVAGPPRAASVLLEIGIAEDGSVPEVTVLESAGEALDAAAEAAVKQFRFEPAQIDGKPAAVKIQYRYDFTPPPPVETQPEGGPPSEFSGVVLDGHTKTPLAGVVVELDTGEKVTTGPDGRFTFAALPPGSYAVTLSGPNFIPVGTEETIEPGRKYEANYEVELRPVDIPEEERSDFEIVVTVPRLDKKVGSTQVSAEQGARVAGTGGDAAKVVQNLPGVARPTVGSSALVVWGAGAADTRVYVNGVHIPVLYHEGGYRSVVHSDLVKSVELQPGGYGAAFGRGLGGLIKLAYRPLNDETYHGSLKADVINASASARGPIAKNVNFAVAAQRSHLDYMLRKFTSQDVGAFVPIPQFYDGQARLAWTPSDNESLEIGGMLSHDRIQRTLLAADPIDTKLERKTSGFNRVYMTYHRRSENGETTFTPFVGTNTSRVESHFGAVPALLAQDSKVYGLRTTWQGQAADWLDVGVGLDGEVVATDLRRAGSVTTPPREGDIRAFGQVPSDYVNADNWKTMVASAAPFVQADASLFGDRLHLLPGFRIEPTVIQTSRVKPQEKDIPAIGRASETTLLEPRGSVRFDASDRVMVKGAVGVYHQAPLPSDLSAVFGTPSLPLMNGMHYVLGGAFRLTNPLSFEVTSFYTRSGRLARRSLLPTPALAQALIAKGRGRAFGTQFLLRHDPVGRFFGWASLTIMHSERTDPNGSWRRFDFDQPFVFTVVGSYDLGVGFELGSRFRWASGYPRTPVISSYFDSRLDAYQPVFGAHNSIRIPPFYQLDIRLTKKFKFSQSENFELYLDVQNVSNHRNPEEIVYNYNYSKRSYITGLPLLPVFGARLAW